MALDSRVAGDIRVAGDTDGPVAGASPVPAGRVAAWVVGRSFVIAAATLLALALLPILLQWHPVVVVSGSMAPAIEPGDVLVYRGLGSAAPQPGQVLVVDDPAHPGWLVSHRLVRIEVDGRLRLRGDANPVADSTPVPRSSVRGVAVLRVPFVGLPALWLRQGPVADLALTVVVLVGSGAMARSPLPEAEQRPSGRRRRTAGDPPPPVPRPRPGDAVGAPRSGPRHA